MIEPSSAQHGDTSPENPDHMWNRSRAFQEAMAAAKLDRSIQAAILYIAHHCDFHGVARVTLAYVADRLGYQSRGGVQYAVLEAAAAGFLSTEVDPADRRRTVYRIPLMAAPGSRRQQLRDTTAQLQAQLRGGTAQKYENCAVADRAPSIEELDKEEWAERDITRDPGFDLHDEIQRLKEQLRNTDPGRYYRR